MAVAGEICSGCCGSSARSFPVTSRSMLRQRAPGLSWSAGVELNHECPGGGFRNPGPGTGVCEPTITSDREGPAI